MPRVSIICVILAWLVALGGAIAGVNLFWNGNLDGAVGAVIMTLIASMALVAGAVRKDTRCDGFYEITTSLDLIM